jgi:hypothetical protein
MTIATDNQALTRRPFEAVSVIGDLVICRQTAIHVRARTLAHQSQL